MTQEKTGRKKTTKTRTFGNGKPEVHRVDQYESIRQRAYEIFQERCLYNLPGDEVSDWIQAETEINTHS